MIYKTKDLLSLLFIIILFYVCFLINSKYTKPNLTISPQDSTINFNNDLIQFFSLGQRRLISSLLWTETMLNSDLDHYKNNDLNSWMYHRFNTISELTPRFYENYLYGGIYLSIIKDDALGAKTIYEKGLKQYPQDYYLLFNSGFHYFYEMNNSQKAVENLEKILGNPKAPPSLPSLIARIKSENNDLIGAFNLLLETFKISPENSPLRTKLARDLYAIKAELDLECLNSNKENCSYQDFYGQNYRFDGRRYYSELSFEKYRVKKRGQ